MLTLFRIVFSEGKIKIEKLVHQNEQFVDKEPYELYAKKNFEW